MATPAATNHVQVRFLSMVSHGVPPNKKVEVAKVLYQTRNAYVDPYALALGPKGAFVDTNRGSIYSRAWDAVQAVVERTAKAQVENV